MKLEYTGKITTRHTNTVGRKTYATGKRTWEHQMSFEKERRESSSKKKLADNMAKWKDSDQPEDYIQHFQETIKEARISETEWPARLRLLLTGKALTSYSRYVPEESKNVYYKDQYGRDLCTFTKKSTESRQKTARTLEFMIGRCLEGCESLKDVCSVLAKFKLFSLSSLLYSSFVQLQKPATPVETIHSQTRNSQYHQSRPWHRNSDRSGGREWSSEKGRQTGGNGYKQ